MSSERALPPSRESSADKRVDGEREGQHRIYPYQPSSSNSRRFVHASDIYRTNPTNTECGGQESDVGFTGHPRQQPVRYGSMSRRTSNQYQPPPQFRRLSEIVLPRWQPDSEVDKCPVCDAEFSLWFRKHHCRKCGRVVCSSCSPHRITIPRQYIVQPPNPYAEETGDMSPVGGGEVVRVCKPCVPDPWTPNANATATSFSSSNNNSVMPRRSTLPDTINPTPRGQSGSSRHDLRFEEAALHAAPNLLTRRNLNLTSQPSTLPWALAPTAEQRWSLLEREVALARERGPANFRPGRMDSLSNNDRYALEIERMNAVGQDTRYPSRPHRHSHAGGLGGMPHESFSPLWLPGPAGSNRTGTAAVPARAPPPPPTSSADRPPPSRRQVAEEDECPVCGEEMAPGEAIREAHITECIASRSAFGTSAPPASNPLAASPMRAMSFASTTPDSSGSPRPRASSYRPRGMAVYKATEKDCTTEDGEPQECVICFEEFQPGDELGRMECWCKFHRVCIRRWWETKGGGSCPTHQLHE